MASNNFSVVISATDKVSAAVNRINQSIERITKPARDLQASFSGLGKEVGLDRVAQSMKSVGAAAADAARQVASVLAPLSAIAGMGSIAGIALLANEWGKLGAEVQRTSAVIGVSTGDLQAYRGAAKLAGLSADDMTGSLKSLGRTLQDATYGRNQDALVMMHKIGLTLHRTKNGAIDATRALKDVANAIVDQKGNVQTQSLIAGAFGVESLLPLLQKGGKGIEEFVRQARVMGLVFDEKQLANGQKFNVQMLKLEAAATRLKYQFGNALAPAVERVIAVVGRLIDKYGAVVASKVAEYVERFAKWLDQVDWQKTADSIGKFVDQIGGVKGVAIAIAAISFAGPIAGVLSLISNLTLLATVTVPAALKALAEVATAQGAAGGAGAAGTAAGLSRFGALGVGLGVLFGVTQGMGWALNKIAPNHKRGDADSQTGAVWVPGVNGRGGHWEGGDKHEGQRFVRSGRGGYYVDTGPANDPATAGIVGRLQQMGWSREQAAGMAANLWQESGYNPSKGGDKGEAYGIAQWHASRQADFKKRFGIDIRKSSLDQQLQFMDYELRQGNEQPAGRALLGANNAADAGSIVSRLYERPKEVDAEAANRGQMATAIDQKLHVDVHLHNAPAGTRATASVRGNANATARVGTSNVTGPQA